jgi:RNA polymerase sigma-70 factor (ECF subfamily)
VTALRVLPADPRAELDREVVEAARRGERSAQARVVDRFARPIWALACRMLGSAGRREATDDITQDALLAVLRSLPRYRFEAGRFSAWVMTIAARTVIDELRRRTDLAPALEIIDDDERPDRRSERRATVRAIEDAVGNLPPEYRAAFVLRAYHELEYGEIADALGIDIGTVKSRLWRARAQLQAALAEVRDER